jgi:alkanesulfonate monooxygenase SsuD/methylene tetrahydromethanopterin reductase-like flavin-dependent oxidoreductase (luciferase family)
VALGCFIPPGRSMERAIERAKLADSLGYEAGYSTQLAGRDALTVLTAYAMETERIRLGTGVVPIYSRPPSVMAQTAVTIDEISGGRFILGLGVSHRPVVEGWLGQTIDRPVAEMKEYVGIVRAVLRGEDPPQGTKWRTAFRLAGADPRPDIPVYIAALSPAMLRAAGEIADGVILWLCVPSYIEAVVVPEVRKGRERAGKTMDGFDVVAAVPSALVDDPGEAFTAMRQELLTYFSLPFYRAAIERAGFGDEIAAFDAAGATGDVDAMKAAISDRFLEHLCAVGDEAALHDGIGRYARAGATSPCLGAVPKTDFDATLRAAAPDAPGDAG